MARKKRHFLGPVLLLAAGAALGWSLTRYGLPLLKSVQWPAAPAAAGDIRRVDFRNFTYPAACAAENGQAGGIRVRNGEYTRAQSDDPLYFSVASVSFGDLTGDGRDEAAVATDCNTGGTGQFSEGLVFSMRDGRPALIERLEVGDRAYGGIAGLKIEGGQLVVERYGTDEGGPYCCPRYIDTMRLRWDGGRFTQAGGVVRRKLPDN
jgi:hypothetical protein